MQPGNSATEVDPALIMPFLTPPPQAEPDAISPITTIVEGVETAPGEREIWPEPVEGGSGAQLLALLRYLTQTDVHTYAFSVAANVILSLFPFIVLLLTISQRVFHSPAMVVVVGQLMHSYLPTGQDFVMRNMNLLVHPQKGVQVFSVVMLLVSSTGVFLPLEVALNNVWRATKNRSYLHNQLVSLGLAMAAGVLAMFSVGVSTAQQTVLGFLFFGHTNNLFFRILSHGFLAVLATVSSITLFFLIYWVLPNRKIPVRAVLPTAIVTGLLWEGAKHLYIVVLPHLDFGNVYGPFQISVGLMLWAFLSGLMLLAGAHFSATRHAVRMAGLEG
ncbi:MAG: YihY/virulence factor BrkB family protein [Janthinobacterium lividum]